MRVVETFVKDVISAVTYCNRCRTIGKTLLSAIPATNADIEKIKERISEQFCIPAPPITPLCTITQVVKLTTEARNEHKLAQQQAQKNNKYFSQPAKGRCL